MTKFIVLYHADPAAMEEMKNKDPADAEKGMEAWMQWAQKCGPALVDLGNPLGNAQSVDQSGASPANSTVAGYSILEADSIEHATALLEGHPHLGWNEDCSIEVHEAFPVPGS